MTKRKKRRNPYVPPKFKTEEGVVPKGNCPRCKEEKPLLYFKQISYLLKKTNFKILICQDCAKIWGDELRLMEKKSKVDESMIELFAYMASWDLSEY